MEQLQNKALQKLSERAKELECLHMVEEAIAGAGGSEMKLFEELIKIIPAGMQFSTVCEVKITYADMVCQSEEFRGTEWMIYSDLVVDKDVVGQISVAYTQFIRGLTQNQFLPEEQRMLDNIASRVSCWLLLLILKGSGNDKGKK